MNEVLLECFPIYLVSQHFHSVLVLVLTIPVCWIENHSKVPMSPRCLFPWQTESPPTYKPTHTFFEFLSLRSISDHIFWELKLFFILARSDINIKRNWFYLSPFPLYLLKQSPILKRLLIKKYKTLQSISFFLIRNQKERSHLNFWIFSWH